MAAGISSAGNSGFRQRFPKSIHAGPGGRFRRARASPVGFKAQLIAEAVALQSLKLTNPVYDAPTHGSPVVFVVRLTYDILAMTMPDAIFRQKLIAGRIRRIAEGCGISRIPVEHEISVGNTPRALYFPGVHFPDGPDSLF